jgi:hypothetical protein
MNSFAILKLACFVVTDGGIYPPRNQIYFDSVDIKLIEAFIKTARELGIKKLYINKGHGTFQAYFYSKEVSKTLLRLITPEKILPIVKIIRLSKSQIAEILRILFTTDGGVSFSLSKSKVDAKIRIHRKVTYTSTNSENLKGVQLLLKSLGIRSKIQGNDVEIKGRGNLLRFKKLIGFLKGVKVSNKSKLWGGLTKNQLLNLVIKTYRNTYGE